VKKEMAKKPNIQPDLFHVISRGIPNLFQQSVSIGINVPLLRGIIGVLGLALPIVLVVWGYFIIPKDIPGQHFLGSLSAYYGERTRDAFVGILCTIGCVLFTYTGFSSIDKVLGKVAGILAILVAIFPCIYTDWQGTAHIVSAGSLFFVLALFSLVLFTKSIGSPKDFIGTTKSILHLGKPVRRYFVTKKKRVRNTIYRICGALMIACLITIGLYYWKWQDTFLADTTFVLVFEWIMVWAFGFSWLVKAEIIPVWSEGKRRPNIKH
jgi:hypothetical protein